MIRFKAVLAGSLIVCMGYASSVFALFGLGLHYSLDFSVKMDAAKEQLSFDSLKLTTAGFTGSLPTGWTPAQTITPENIPIFFDRGEMGRTPFGLGAKIYVDIIPFIDCIELGGDFAAFQYDGRIIYPSNIEVVAPTTTNLSPDQVLAGQMPNLVKITYDTLSTNIEEIEGAPAIPGLTKTPYAKLDLGITLRKYIKIPIVDNVLRPYGGLGFNVLFATPVPSAGLLNDALGEDLSGNKSVAEIMEVMQGGAAKKVTDEIFSRLMTPHFGMNIIVGLMLKPPVVPIGIYVDGKYAIPFGKLDDDANVTGMGFKVNAGLCLHFGKKKT
jgi:hypothetical protein